MSGGGRAGTSSAAKRRRERRLRAAWRHERLGVRMALAAAQHHSAPKCAGPETQEASRGQTTARAAAGAQHFCLDLDEALAALPARPAHGGQAARAGPAAHRGPDHRRTVARCSCAADGLRMVVLFPSWLPKCPRSSAKAVPQPQLVEQLVEVPTALSVAVLQQRTAAREEKELLPVPTQLRTPAQWARLPKLIGASSRARRRMKKRRKRKGPRGALVLALFGRGNQDILSGSHLFACLARGPLGSTGGCIFTSVYRGFRGTSRRSCVKVDLDLAVRRVFCTCGCATTGARGLTIFGLSVRSHLPSPTRKWPRSSSQRRHGWFCWLRCTSRCVVISRCVLLDCRQAQDFRHHGRYGQADSGCSPTRL